MLVARRSSRLPLKFKMFILSTSLRRRHSLSCFSFHPQQVDNHCTMVLSAQAKRAVWVQICTVTTTQLPPLTLTFCHANVFRCRRVFTGVACTGVALQAVFFTEYELEGYDGDHVFTGVQRETRILIDKIFYGINTRNVAVQKQVTKDESNNR